MGRPHQTWFFHGNLLLRSHLMGTFVGSANRVSTWGKFRCVMAYNGNVDYTFRANNINYGSGVKSAATGSGLIRYVPWNSTNLPGPRQPHISNTAYSPSPGLTSNQLYTVPPAYTSPLDYTQESRAATIEVQNELNGETVTFSNGMITTIDPILWSTNRQTWMTSSTFSWPDITSVGKLASF